MIASAARLSAMVKSKISPETRSFASPPHDEFAFSVPLQGLGCEGYDDPRKFAFGSPTAFSVTRKLAPKARSFAPLPRDRFALSWLIAPDCYQ